VGIQNPNEKQGIHLGILRITERAVVTSGVYERFFEYNGQCFHHIFSPSKGYPTDNSLLSVTIITDCSMDADALSTAVFVLGFEQGKTLIESIPGTEAVFILKDNSIWATPGVDFTLIDKSYRVNI